MAKRRILIIDDSEDIHRDFSRILGPQSLGDSEELERLEAALFGTSFRQEDPEPMFELDSAFQGQEGLAKVREAEASGHPYDLVFLDYRMPPGWNGLETLRHLRQIAPSLPVVLCSAYSDYSWEEIRQVLGGDRELTELRKPFNKPELHQLVLSLTQA